MQVTSTCETRNAWLQRQCDFPLPSAPNCALPEVRKFRRSLIVNLLVWLATDERLERTSSHIQIRLQVHKHRFETKPYPCRMSAHALAIDVFKWLTLGTTLMLRVSLLPDFRRMHKNHSTGDMSVMPCLLLFTNCYAVMFYAIAIDNILPLLAVSILGIVTGSSSTTSSTAGQWTNAASLTPSSDLSLCVFS